MKLIRISIAAAALCAAVTLGLVNLGCTVDSANELIRDVSINFSGFYEGNLDGGKMVSHNAGLPIRTFKLIQQGDQIDGVDNNGAIWSGELEDANNNVSSFIIRGNDSQGNSAVISGTLTLGGGSSGTNGTSTATDATMRGNYFQGSIVSVVHASSSSVPGQDDDDDGGGGTNTTDDVSITADGSTTLSTNGASVGLNASGGDGTYVWSLSGTSGALSSTTGSSVTYTRSASGANTVTVTDDSGSSTYDTDDSITISQP